MNDYKTSIAGIIAAIMVVLRINYPEYAEAYSYLLAASLAYGGIQAKDK